jgi:hypothetical protein
MCGSLPLEDVAADVAEVRHHVRLMWTVMAVCLSEMTRPERERAAAVLRAAPPGTGDPQRAFYEGAADWVRWPPEPPHLRPV